MRKQWLGMIIAGLLLSACTTPDNQPQQAAPEPAYNGPVVEIGGADPVYEQPNANANNDYSANGNSYKVIRDASRFTQTGTATWYGTENGSNVTASGEEFDASAMTAAHPTLPIPSYVRVTNLANGRMLVVRVNDRGPFTSDKIIDLSKAAFDRLNLTNSTRVKLDIINVAPDGTLSGPGTIGTTVAKQTYALPSRPSLGASDMGTPMQSAPPAIGAAVRPIDNSTLQTQNDDDNGNGDASNSSASNGGSGFLQAPKPLPSGVLESSEPAAEESDNTYSTAAVAAAPVVAAPVVAPRAAPAPRQSAPVSGGGFMVQVGALSNPQNAELWQKSLSKRFSVPGKVQTNGSNYRVQLGPFSSRQQATQLQQRLASEAQQQSFVVSASAM